MGGVLLPGEQATDRTGFVDKTVMEFLAAKHPPERKPSLFYFGIIRGNAYFYYGGDYGGCGRVSFAETFGEHRDWWNGLGGFTGVDTKIWG